MDQHYSPKFYLNGWARPADQQLTVMRRVCGKVVVKRKHPSGSGYGVDIYKTDGVPECDAQHFETKFFSPLDNHAAICIARMIERQDVEWSSADRSAWTAFLVSLLVRNPENVQAVKAHIEEMWGVAIAELEANWAERRRPNDSETFAEYLALMNPAAPQIGATNFLIGIIGNMPQVHRAIFEFDWRVHYLDKARFALMTSDRPVVMPAALDNDKSWIGLPLSPRVLFVAARRPRFNDWLSSVKHTDIVKQINRAVVTQAREFVWAQDDHQREFVQKYFGTAPDRGLISEYAREQSLKVARGELEASS